MSNLLIRADARRIPLADGSVHCCVTSPPYFGLRAYLKDGDPRRSLEVGREPTPAEYIAGMVAVFREVRRVLRKDGTLWVNIGDSYNSSPPGNKNPMSKSTLNGVHTSESYRNRLIKTQQDDQEGRRLIPGMKPKDMIGIPWMLALALRDDGWYLRSDVTWNKNNPMPSSVKDRPSMADERLFLLAKSPRYYFDKVALPPDRRRTVWTIPTAPTKHAHFATFPWRLVEPCILAGTSAKGCCGACGAPVRRVVERTRKATRPARESKVYEPDPGLKQDALGNRTYTGFNKRWKDSQEVGNRDPGRHVTVVKTVGWEATCKCGADRVPCRVLDPFAGACTTGLACGLHGRDFVGLDLSLDYLLDIGRPRLARGLIPRAGRERKRRGDLPGQTTLFDSLLPGVVPQETPA